MAHAPADPSELRRSDMPPHRALKPSGTLAGYNHAAPTALDSRASRGERVEARVGSNARFMDRLRLNPSTTRLARLGSDTFSFRATKSRTSPLHLHLLRPFQQFWLRLTR
jgi:hypothetical protein